MPTTHRIKTVFGSLADPGTKLFSILVKRWGKVLDALNNADALRNDCSFGGVKIGVVADQRQTDCSLASITKEKLHRARFPAGATINSLHRPRPTYQRKRSDLHRARQEIVDAGQHAETTGQPGRLASTELRYCVLVRKGGFEPPCLVGAATSS